jgi:7,8-dihydropterin-6-yl-methyl-4-(beta-D-ribofuranosyl)aminobenzene 5'-phosphate synthase
MKVLRIRITTLSDNIAGEGFHAEWGLSLLIEADGKRILFDAGASDVAVRNARLLNIDLKRLDAIVLSHGHADHTGGLLDVLRDAGPTTIIAHPDIFKPRYVLRPGEETRRSIGLPYSKIELEKYGASFILDRESFGIASGILTSGTIPLRTSYENIEENLLVKNDEVFEQDKIFDDISLIINTQEGLIVVLGCAHRGVINTLLHARILTGIRRVAMVIGGMHLIQASEERIESTINGLKEIGVQRIIISHCTGTRASERLKQEFGECCLLNSAGSHFALPS